MSPLYHEIAIIIFCSALLCLTSLAEAALLSVDRIRIRSLSEAGDRHAHILNRLVDDRHSLLAAIIILINASLLTISGISTRIFKRELADSWLAFLINLGMIFFILAFLEVAPKALALRHAEKLAFTFARPTTYIVWLLSPLIKVVTLIGRTLLDRIVVPVLGGTSKPSQLTFSEEEIKQILDVSEERGELDAEEKDMLTAAIEFADKAAREIMVPRPDMICLDEKTTIAKAVEIGTQSGYSRLPVFKGDLDHIVGILFTRDLLSRLTKGAGDKPITDLMRPPYFVPESRKIDDLLRDMQGLRAHLAIIIDEYGSVSGLISIEDILEEIVGEIRDEHDGAEEEPLKIIDENTILAQALISPDDISEHFDVPLPEGDYDTLGGFLIEQLGRLPEKGDEIKYASLLFTIMEVREQRVHKVRVVKQESEVSEEDDIISD